MEKLALYKEHRKNPFFAERVYLEQNSRLSVDNLCHFKSSANLNGNQERFLDRLDHRLEQAKDPKYLQLFVEHRIFELDPNYPGHSTNPDKLL